MSNSLRKELLVPGTIHIVISHSKRTAKAFDSNGKMLWKTVALTDGVNDDVDLPGGDTPMGLWKCGQVMQTTSAEPKHIWNSYGLWFIDLIDLEGQETGRGRAGIGMHGGGTGLYNPLADEQPLIMTHGCVRWKNGDLKKLLVPLVRQTQQNGHTAYVTTTV